MKLSQILSTINASSQTLPFAANFGVSSFFDSSCMSLYTASSKKELPKNSLQKRVCDDAFKDNFQIIAAQNLEEITFDSIEIDSRKVKKNSVFFALQGKTNNGEEFIESAIKSGACCIIAKNISAEIVKKNPQIIFIKSENPFSLLVEFLQKFYSDLPKNIYAITGTNGKSSIAEFSRQILQFLGKKSATIGTLGIKSNIDLKNQIADSALTTPDLVSLYKNLAILKKNQIDDVAIEVSSIGLEQDRIAGINLSVGAFSNFTQDHLDYHGTMQQYFECKMLLFSKFLKSGAAVLNADIPEFAAIKEICQKHQHKIISYGFKADDLKLEKIITEDLTQKVFFKFKEKDYNFTVNFSGEFQVFNVLCALGNVLGKYDLSCAEIKNLLVKFSDLKTADGRMQLVASLPNKAQIFIDFAHSPDALENILKLARKISKNRLVVLFGCGGNRDAKKRPQMGKIACDLADFVIVTDDNPRKENPAQIRSEILASCNMSKTLEIDDRKAAIEAAIKMLKENDILILAGKGHEKYQIIGDEKHEFDEEQIVLGCIEHLTRFNV